MYLKIYFDDRPLFLCDEIVGEIEPFVHHDDAIFIDEMDSHTIKSMIHEMQQPQVKAGVFFHTDLAKLQKEFFKKFTVLVAGGGAVLSPDNKVLLIYRRGYWDLPKGKLDPGESIEDCALREVREETGLREVELVTPLLNTYHTYHEGTRFILKESVWFQMKASDTQPLKAQEEEDITAIKWASIPEARDLFPLMYPSVRDVINAL